MASIVGSTDIGYDYRYGTHGVTGIEYNGNQFIFAAAGGSGGDSKLHVFMSTNNGTSWSDVTSVSLDDVPSFCVCQSGSVAYILSVGTDNGGPSTDLCTAITGWSCNLTSGALTPLSLSGPQVYKFWHGATPSTYQSNKCVGLSLVRLSSGAMWFIFQGAPEAISSSKWARLNICSFDGSSFGSPVVIDGQAGNAIAYTQGGVCVDGSDNTHIIFVGHTEFVYYHIGMTSGGAFGTRQSIETDGFFPHLDPPEEVSNFISFGSQIGFVGVNNSASADGDIVFYYGSTGLNPSWSTSLISASGGSAVVVNPTIGSGLSTSCNIVNNTLYVFWTVSGTTPHWRVSEFGGRIASRNSPVGSWTWGAETDFITPVGSWSAAVVNSWTGPINGLAVFAGFTANSTTELGMFSAISSSADAHLFTDTIVLTDSITTNATQSNTGSASDTVALVDGTPQTHLTGIDLPPVITVPPGVPFPKPQPVPNPGSNCIFEFYEMLQPEDVEVLPVPKKYDQLGPMRFDKIGKIFGFRVRLIPNGSINSMPYAIYGDDSESSPHLNSPLFSGSFAVRSGFDNVYEIQLPKSINTDIFRLTLGPTTDSFHRYNVLVKVHISGMQGQAKWLPIR